MTPLLAGVIGYLVGLLTFLLGGYILWRLERHERETNSTPTHLKVVVDRTKWYRGKGGDNSRLRNSDGLMCCMGFAALASHEGVKESDILGHPTIAVALRFGEFPEEVNCLPFWQNWVEHRHLYSINDHPKLAPSERERRLIEEGLKVGIEFSFVGEEAPFKD